MIGGLGFRVSGLEAQNSEFGGFSELKGPLMESFAIFSPIPFKPVIFEAPYRTTQSRCLKDSKS